MIHPSKKIFFAAIIIAILIFALIFSLYFLFLNNKDLSPVASEKIQEKPAISVQEDRVLYSFVDEGFFFMLPKTISFSSLYQYPFSDTGSGKILGAFIPDKNHYKTREDKLSPFAVFLSVKYFDTAQSEAQFVNNFKLTTKNFCGQLRCAQEPVYALLPVKNAIPVFDSSLPFIDSLYGTGKSVTQQAQLLRVFPIPDNTESGKFVGAIFLIPYIDNNILHDSMSFLAPFHEISEGFTYSVQPKAHPVIQPAIPSLNAIPVKYKSMAEVGELKLYQNSNIGIEFWYPKNIRLESKEEGGLLVWPEGAGAVVGSKIGTSLEFNATDNEYGNFSFILNNCAADGPGGSDFCEEPSTSHIYKKTNTHNVHYAIFDTRAVFDSSDGISTSYKVGPYAMVPLFKPFYLIFYPPNPLNEEYSAHIAKDLAIILDTLRFIPFADAGIGILFSKTAEGIVIENIFKDYPADAAGLKVGDVILTIDGVLTKDIDVEIASRLIGGDVGSELSLQINPKIAQVHGVQIRRVVRNIADIGNNPPDGLFFK